MLSFQRFIFHFSNSVTLRRCAFDYQEFYFLETDGEQVYWVSVPHFGVLAARPLFLPVHIRPFVFGERAFELGGHWDQPWGLASLGVHAKPQRGVSQYLNHICLGGAGECDQHRPLLFVWGAARVLPRRLLLSFATLGAPGRVLG